MYIAISVINNLTNIKQRLNDNLTFVECYRSFNCAMLSRMFIILAEYRCYFSLTRPINYCHDVTFNVQCQCVNTKKLNASNF